MTQTHQNPPPIPRQPIGATFVVAISILGLAFLVQLLAVAGYFLPKLRQQVAEGAPAASINSSTDLPPATPAPQPVQRPVQPAIDPATAQRIGKLVADSDRSFRIGEFEPALEMLQQAAELLPNDPGILLRQARIFESLQRPGEASAVYSKVLSIEGLNPQLRAQAEKKLASLGGDPSGAHKSQAGAASADEGGGGSDVRDETGLQPGSKLGIVDSRLRDGAPGTKALRVAIKSRPNFSVDTRQMKLHVFFYERDDAGDVQLTESKVVSQWISPPVNWKEDEPELLDVNYTVPDSSTGRQFVGYIVGIYYDGELQDTRADPGSLAGKFPLPLYLKQGAE